MTTDKPLLLDHGQPRRRTAVDLVRDALRNAILSGDLPGDAQLVQTDIAEQLGVSTTPVREAMRDLVVEGLIEMKHHKIGAVRKPDWAEMAEIARVRQALEPMAIELAMENITPEHLAEARELADRLAGSEDLGSWVRDNIAFHSVFHRATNTIRLTHILISLEEGGGMFVAQAQRLDPEIRGEAVADHFALLEAFKAKDIAKATEIQMNHVGLPLEPQRRRAQQEST